MLHSVFARWFEVCLPPRRVRRFSHAVRRRGGGCDAEMPVLVLRGWWEETWDVASGLAREKEVCRRWRRSVELRCMTYQVCMSCEPNETVTGCSIGDILCTKTKFAQVDDNANGRRRSA